MISAAVFLFLLNIVFKVKTDPALFKIKNTWISAVALVLYQIFFFTGVKMTGIAVGTVLMLGSSTVFAGLLELLLIGEKPERKWYLSSLMSLAGCVILVAGTAIEIDPRGAVFSVCSGFSYSLFSVCSKKVLNDSNSSVFIMTVFILSAILSVPLLFLRPPVWILNRTGFAVALYLGFFATAVAYYLYTGGLKLTKASTAVTLALAEPAAASLLGIFFIGEKLTLYSVSGIAVIFTGLVYLSTPERRKVKE